MINGSEKKTLRAPSLRSVPLIKNRGAPIGDRSPEGFFTDPYMGRKKKRGSPQHVFFFSRTSKFLPRASAMCRGPLEFGRSTSPEEKKKKNVFSSLRRPSFFFSPPGKEKRAKKSEGIRSISREDFLPFLPISGPFFPLVSSHSKEMGGNKREKGRIFSSSWKRKIEDRSENRMRFSERSRICLIARRAKEQIQDFSFRRLPSKIACDFRRQTRVLFLSEKGRVFPDSRVFFLCPCGAEGIKSCLSFRFLEKKNRLRFFFSAPAVENRLRFSTAGEGPFFLVLFLKEKGRIFSDSFRSRGKYRKKGEFFPLPIFPPTPSEFGENPSFF